MGIAEIIIGITFLVLMMFLMDKSAGKKADYQDAIWFRLLMVVGFLTLLVKIGDWL